MSSPANQWPSPAQYAEEVKRITGPTRLLILDCIDRSKVTTALRKGTAQR